MIAVFDVCLHMTIGTLTRLLGIGADLSVYTNDLSAIHTVLKRLNEAGEIRFVAKAGKHAFIWNHLPTAVVMSREMAALLRHPHASDVLSPPTRRRRK